MSIAMFVQNSIHISLEIRGSFVTVEASVDQIHFPVILVYLGFTGSRPRKGSIVITYNVSRAKNGPN